MVRRRRNPGDSKFYFEWLKNASEDIHVAQILVNDKNSKNACAFHCQQAIEKALKAYLLLASGKLMDGHNLTWLCRQAIKFDGEFEQWFGESTSLSRYYIETRYPADIPLKLTSDEVKRVFSMAKSMYDFITLQVDEEEEELMEQYDNDPVK